MVLNLAILGITVTTYHDNLSYLARPVVVTIMSNVLSETALIRPNVFTMVKNRLMK